MMTAAHGGLRAPYRVRSIDCAKRWSLSDIACCRKLTERESKATGSSLPLAGDASRAAASNCVAAACATKALSSWICASVSMHGSACMYGGSQSDSQFALYYKVEDALNPLRLCVPYIYMGNYAPRSPPLALSRIF